MMRRLVPLATTLLLFAGAATAACGSNSDKNDKKAEGSNSKPAKVLTAEELKKGLLVVSDMPTGYAAVQDEEGSGSPGASASPEEPEASASASSAECERFFNDLENTGPDEESSVSTKFEKSETGPQVTQTLESYKDEDELKKGLETVRDTVKKCGEFSMQEEELKTTIKIADASFPKLGEETMAFKMDGIVTDGRRELKVGGYLVAVRINNVVCTITSVGTPGTDANEIEQITRKAIEKVTPIAKG